MNSSTPIFNITSKAAAAAASSPPSASSTSTDLHSANVTTAFAADELDGVFRTVNATHQQADYQDMDESGMRRRRFINSSSFATDGELSTFSEEDNDGPEMISQVANRMMSPGQAIRRNAFYRLHEQQSPLSIFRSPVSSGSKRQRDIITVDSEDMMDEDVVPQEVKNVSTPLLHRANRICSDDDESSSDDDSSSLISDASLDQEMYTPRAKRGRCSIGDSPSSYISLFSLASPATLDQRGNDSAIITPSKLEHPLSYGRALIEN